MKRPLAVIGLWLAFVSSAYPQSPALPRTPDGHPDFSGAWISSFLTPLERIPGATTLSVSEAEAKQAGEKLYQQLLARENGLDPDVIAANVRNLLRVGNEYRTSVVVDPPTGRIPFSPQGQSIVDAARKKTPVLPDDPEFRPESERCIAGNGRTPLQLTPTVNSRQVVQTSNDLMIYSEDGPDVRIAAIGGQHRPVSMPMWGGDSTAWWEGEELVIDTLNQRGLVRSGPQGVYVVSPQARVTERLKFLAPDEVLYTFTVTDPANYTAPWRAEFTLTRSKTAAVEYSCHEGNYAMVNMLSAGRAAERRLAAETQAKATGKTQKPKPRP